MDSCFDSLFLLFFQKGGACTSLSSSSDSDDDDDDDDSFIFDDGEEEATTTDEGDRSGIGRREEMDNGGGFGLRLRGVDPSSWHWLGSSLRSS